MSNQFSKLLEYSACEIADALLELGVPGAGFLPDITPLANTRTKIIAPATTVLFIPRDPPPSLSATLMPSNIPQGQIYADIIIPSTIVVMSQPRGASTATMGGLMAARMNKLGAQGVLVDGRVRDVAQLTDSRFVHMPVWSRGVSAVATRGECKAHAVGMEVWVGKSRVRQGDLIMLDPEDRCAICIPQDQVGAVLEMVEGIATADEMKMVRVLGGMSVQEAISL